MTFPLLSAVRLKEEHCVTPFGKPDPTARRLRGLVIGHYGTQVEVIWRDHGYIAEWVEPSAHLTASTLCL